MPLYSPATAARGGRGGVDAIVRRKAAESPGALVPVVIHQDSRGAALSAVRSRGGRALRELETKHALAAEVPADQLDAIAASPGVLRVSFDAPVAAQTVTASL